MHGNVQISFVERKRFNQRREAMQNFADNRRFSPVNIESRRQHDQFWTTLQRHEGRHCRTNRESSRLVVASGQYTAPISCPADTNWFSTQRRFVSHFDRGVKAIHIEMDDRARRRFHFRKVASNQQFSSRPATLGLTNEIEVAKRVIRASGRLCLSSRANPTVFPITSPVR